MSATIVNETTYTVWCSECPYSEDPTIYRDRAQAAMNAHNAVKHPPQPESPLLGILRQAQQNTRGSFA